MSSREHTESIDVRLRDVDFMGHVNNAVYATYLEEARASFFTDVIGESLVTADTVLANLSIDYREPINDGQTVHISMTIGSLGRSSIHMEYELRVDGELVATATTVQVVVSRDDGSSRPIPAAWRTRMEPYCVG